MMLDKPEIGQPCNNCGLCCQSIVCSAGSLVLGLVDKPGARAKGPCPALTRTEFGYSCGVMLKPHSYLRSRRGPTVLRNAFGLLIGAGMGCDEAGDEPEETAEPKLREIQINFLNRYSKEEINKAWGTLLSE